VAGGEEKQSRYDPMTRTTPLTALASSTLLAMSACAQAETYTYRCQGSTVKLDEEARTITWKGRVFSNARLTGGDCRLAYQATDKSGTVATLCTSTQGYATLNVGSHRLECMMAR
jgi:hypothetical protein